MRRPGLRTSGGGGVPQHSAAAAGNLSSISGSTTVTLSKGCTLKVAGGAKALKGNTQCEIKGGSLSCN